MKYINIFQALRENREYNKTVRKKINHLIMNKIHDGISILPENSDKVDELSSLDV